MVDLYQQPFLPVKPFPNGMVATSSFFAERGLRICGLATIATSKLGTADTREGSMGNRPFGNGAGFQHAQY